MMTLEMFADSWLGGTKSVEPIFRQSPYEFDGTSFPEWRIVVEGDIRIVSSGQLQEITQVAAASVPVQKDST